MNVDHNIIAFPKIKQCKHDRVTVNELGTGLSCQDCDKTLDLATTLQKIIKQIQQKEERLNSKRKHIETLLSTSLNNQAAKKIQTILNSDRVPCCPHCDLPLSSKDIINAKQTHKGFANHNEHKPLHAL